MEIKYGGAHRSRRFEVLVKEAPSTITVDDKGLMILELDTVDIDRMQGEYNVRVILSAEDMGKILPSFISKQ